MKIFKSLAFVALLLTIGITGCKPKDADIKAAVEKSFSDQASLAGTTVEVTDGVVTLGGEVPDEAARSLAETTAKSVKGVKSVNNNTTPPAPVVIAGDDVLNKNVMDAVKDYPTVVATVNDGVVTLTGEIQKASLQKLMMSLSALNPKQVDNKLTVN